MQTILVGRLDSQQRADALFNDLRARGIAREDITAFYLTAPGQHARYAIGGDRYSDPESKAASQGQLTGAAIGAAAGLVVGAAASAIVPPMAPAIIAGATGVGALAGSVVGAVGSTEPPRAAAPAGESQEIRRGGLTVAVRVTAASEGPALDALRNANAADIARARGEWKDGNWVDFDPLKPLQPVAVEKES